MEKRIKEYFQRVDYIFRHNALGKLATKKAWYNYNDPFGFKILYFFAFYDLIFLAIILSERIFVLTIIRINTEGFSFIWLILASTFVAGVLPALMLLYSLIKALVGNK